MPARVRAADKPANVDPAGWQANAGGGD